MSDVLCMGELLAEFVSTKPNVSLVDAPGFVRAPGGAPANVAVGVSRLGLTSGFIGKVGNDPFGDYLRRSLEEADVGTQGLQTDDSVRTTAVFVAVWDDGRKDLCFYRNPGADMMLTAAELDLALIESARCLHFGSIGFIDEPIASAQHAAIRAARASGAMISYDPNYRPTLWDSPERAASVIRDVYGLAHLVKISEEEWEIATGTSDFQSGAKLVLDAGAELVVISCGVSGAIATNGDYWIELPAPTVDVVETTGAGDGFLAAMIVKLLPWREKLGSLAAVDEAVVRDALDYANSVGALTCTRVGAIPALPTASEVDEFRS
jgi:fructokinase